MFKYLTVLGLCISASAQAGCFGCVTKSAAMAGTVIDQQIENGNAERLAAKLLTQGLNKLDKNGDLEKHAGKFQDITGLKAEANEHGVIISSPVTGVAVSYIPNSDRAKVLTSLLGGVVAAHAASQPASSQL